ncbi:hypothetical protein BCR39DRAFT_542764 [Naematelia encephala]|uniref:Rap1-interacting factor 1 N terminal-domain-containing protein n=1 Tax=Naematelia encephala TaxID=71784 RepID=A0A1Y2AUL1_9TREE|nr:hypothetical protein BCR39DRAFT_542764 [Naematelia encephala]
MTVATRSTHVSFSDDSMLASSSTSPFVKSLLVPASSSSEKPALIPLGPARTVGELTAYVAIISLYKLALMRRGVIFSPQNVTKYFNSDDSIIPDKCAPPPSIRQYHDSSSDAASPYDTPPLSRCSTRPPSEDSSLHRSILKQRVQEIRLAASVEEGTLNNKEPARLLVSGKRPRLMARDSFQLALMRKAANDGVQIPPSSDGKGKERSSDEIGSDDSSSSEGSQEREAEEREGSWEEEEEELEEDGALATASLIHIILDGAEDLLTLEEAYSTLTLRLRQRIPIDGQKVVSMEESRIVTQPIRDEAPAMVRAIQRDLQRLLGKVPNAEVSNVDNDSPPFGSLVPLQDSTPVNRSRLTPSPTPTPGNGKTTPDRPSRQGYTESEVRYRREASGVGAAVLRFLAFVLHTPQLYSCFTDADLQGLLEQVMIIPRTPKLPTPNPKRTYLLSILVIAQIRIPASCVQPIREKIARAVDSALNDTLGSIAASGPGAKEGPSQVRKEAYQAVINLLSTYPAIFFQHYGELLPGCLRALTSNLTLVRNKASAAIAAFAAARYSLLSDLQSRLLEPAAREAWTRLRQTVLKSEYFVVSHFKNGLRVPGKLGFVYTITGERKTEWAALEQVFKDTVGTAEVYWACSTWAALVSLMGSTYASSGLAAGFDHIMDVSLRMFLSCYSAYPSQALASAFYEWGSASSRSTLAMPVELALTMANDPNAVSRVIEDGRYAWQRSEKAKKISWMITCGLGAAALVYAYTGVALYHEDQPAKEMMAISGLPSSDGAPMPEGTREENLMMRLDKTWEKVVKPMMVSFNSIRAVDKVKLHGWAILDAITAPHGPTTWSLDKLLCARYLSGETFNFTNNDKGAAHSDLLDKLDLESIRASDIPTWGSAWVARNLEPLLDTFQEMLVGVNGIADPSTARWLRDEAGLPLIPLVISRVWSNIVRAVATIKQTSDYPRALGILARHLSQAFARDPASYFPLRSTTADGHFAEDSNLSRLGLLADLFDTILAALGSDSVGSTRLASTTDDVTSGNAEPSWPNAYGSDVSGAPTLAGYLLGQLLRESNLSLPLSPQAKATLKLLTRKILDIGSTPGFSGKLLGDMTNQMPWIFQDQEEIQLDVWRLLSLKWTEVIDLQPATTTSSTNHTGALLVSLLSGPFRGRQVDSVWHQKASQEDLEAWQALLKVTVLRFRAKRVGSNLGVLESLAGHLGDFLEQGEKTCSTTITLSCLASATSWIAFGPLEQHDTAHFSINENFVPVEFLTLVSNALLESYPHTDSLSTTPETVPVSPAVLDLITALHDVFAVLPPQFVAPVLDPVRIGLSIWLADDARIVDTESLAGKLDEMYMTLLAKIREAIHGDFIEATGDILDSYIDIYAPRLSRARTPAVPAAFQSFWNSGFSGVGLELSEDVKEFLGELLAAVPGMIEVAGLSSIEPLSEEESQARFPNAQNLRIIDNNASPSHILVDQTTEISVADLPIPGPNVEYDADVSQSVEDTQPIAATMQPLPSPGPSETDSERHVSAETASVVDEPAPDDVFGSTTITRPKRKGKRRAVSSRSSALTRVKSLPEAPVAAAESRSIPSSNSLPVIQAEVVHDSAEEAQSVTTTSSSPAIEPLDTSSTRKWPGRTIELSKPSLLSSATRWFRVPSLHGLFSPTRPEEELSASTAETGTSSPVVSERSARKAKRSKKRDTDEVPPEQLPSTRASKRKPAPIAEPSEFGRGKRRRRGTTASPIEVDEDDEDELLLSPESARLRKQEEEGAIAPGDAPEDPTAAAAISRQASPGPSRQGQVSATSPLASPMRRTAQQSRVMDMIEQATKAKSVIENLDFDGVMSLLRNVEELRNAAMANVTNRAEEGRKAKRSKRN